MPKVSIDRAREGPDDLQETRGVGDLDTESPKVGDKVLSTCKAWRLLTPGSIGIRPTTVRAQKALGYAFLAPDIVRAIVDGRQPVGLTSSYLLHHPLVWSKYSNTQRSAVCTFPKAA